MPRLFLYVPWLLFAVTEAVLPDAEIRLPDQSLEFGRLAEFGSRAATTGTLRKPPLDDPWLCKTSAATISYAADTILLIPRGECSFELKTRNAQRSGAAGVFIYNNLQSRYGWNETSSRVIYPLNQQDYECSNGQDQISNFPLDPPKYDTARHDQLLTQSSDTNVCNIAGSKCASGRCLVTGPAYSATSTACCAWDIAAAMGYDYGLDMEDRPTIFSIFLTMTQADRFLSFPDGTQVSIKERMHPKFNAASFLLVVLATVLTGFASWYSAGDYRRAKYKLTHPVPPSQAPPVPTTPHEVREIGIDNRSGEPPVENAVDDEENQLEMTEQSIPTEESVSSLPHIASLSAQQPSPASSTSAIAAPPAVTNTVEVPAVQNPATNPRDPPTLPLSTPVPVPPVRSPVRRPVRRRSQTRNSPLQSMMTTNANGSIELTICHAAMFIIIASGMLMLLFFFQFYTVVTVMYAIGCSGSVSQILFRPLYILLSRLVGQESFVKSTICPKISLGGFNQIIFVDLISAFSGYLVGAMWLLVWFRSNNPSALPFYWITQNIMGACLCILFLSLLKLNSIKVASVLMLAVFIYDIFFVFITPLFLESSVMVTVATGGGGPDASADYCERYPDYPDCKETVLPMLLALPKIRDYRGGQHLLGLGDIVLPGLLISFAARLDDAKRLIGGHTTLDVKLPTRYGYFFPLIIAYAVGLLFANLAVVWLDGGQPALLYLVPSIGATMIYVGWDELKELWMGPKVIRWADNLALYCDRHTFIAHPSSDEATVVDDESVIDIDPLT